MREAFLWYFDQSPLAADAFGTEVDTAIDGLEVTAVDWPSNEDGVRFYHFKHFPYTLHYDVVGNEVTILAVAHQRREPGFWKRR